MPAPSNFRTSWWHNRDYGVFVANPFGRVTYQAPHLTEEVHVETLDLSGSDRYRTHWPFLRDRRIDSYGPITKRFLDEE